MTHKHEATSPEVGGEFGSFSTWIRDYQFGGEWASLVGKFVEELDVSYERNLYVTHDDLDKRVVGGMVQLINNAIESMEAHDLAQIAPEIITMLTRLIDQKYLKLSNAAIEQLHILKNHIEEGFLTLAKRDKIVLSAKTTEIISSTRRDIEDALELLFEADEDSKRKTDSGRYERIAVQS